MRAINAGNIFIYLVRKIEGEITLRLTVDSDNGVLGRVV